MAYWIKPPVSGETTSYGIKFRHYQFHGPFETVRQAAEFWMGLHGDENGKVANFWQEPELWEFDV